jgi:hypothetical protein
MSLKIVNIYYSNTVFVDVVESLKTLFQSKQITVNVTHTLDKTDKNTWILFGVNELPPSILLPENYIVYQLEQICVEGNKWLTEKYVQIMKGAKQVWDYSMRNVNLLVRYGVKNVFCVPISYSDNLKIVDCSKIPDSEKDIDVLFIGGMSPRRKALLDKLMLVKDIKVYIADGGLWGDERISVLKRSKIVINIHYYGPESLLETVRLSVLLANTCFVVSETGGETGMDKKYTKGVVFGAYNELIGLCQKYLTSVKRTSIAREGFKLFSEKEYQIPFGFYKMIKADVTKQVDLKESKDEAIKPISSNDKIDEIPLRIDSEGYPTIQVPSLAEYPTVSIVTPTKNRKLFVSMMTHQVEKMDYPRDKLQWVILDDSDDIEDFEYIKSTVNQLIGKKIKVDCIHLEGTYTISQKRNMAVENSTGTYICHLDDDDYYFGHSLKNKISFLEHYRDTKGCIGSCKLPVYNLVDDNSIIYETNQLPEASMVYRKTFWEEKQFTEHIEGEGYPFTMGRREQCLDIPYLYSMIAVNHGKNVTGKTRLYTAKPSAPNKTVDGKKDAITTLTDAMDEETQDILFSIKTYMNRTVETMKQHVSF